MGKQVLAGHNWFGLTPDWLRKWCGILEPTIKLSNAKKTNKQTKQELITVLSTPK